MDTALILIPIGISLVALIISGGLLRHNREVERRNVPCLSIEFIHDDEIDRHGAATLLLRNSGRQPISVSALRLSAPGHPARFIFISDRLGEAVAPQPQAGSVTPVQHVELPTGGANFLTLGCAHIALAVNLYRLPVGDVVLELVTGHGLHPIPHSEPFLRSVHGLLSALGSSEDSRAGEPDDTSSALR